MVRNFVFSQVADVYTDKRSNPLFNEVHLKLYSGYKYSMPSMINRIWGLKQLWLQVNGHAWFHLHGHRWAVRNGEWTKNSKLKYMSPAGFEPMPRRPTTCELALQTARPRWLFIKWSIHKLTVSWFMNTNGHVTKHVWNRLCFDSQCKVL